MKRFNPIPDIARLGYTEREAAFLYIVGMNSGFFLARHYTRFLNREPGAVLPQLIKRGERLEHIRTLDWDGRWRLYHLHSRTIYRLLGQEESRNRHEKSNQEVLVRLMVLDYVLDRLPDEFYNGAEEKQALVHDLITSSGELTLTALPTLRKDCFPAFTREKSDTKHMIPQFTYFEYQASTIKAFTRHLSMYAPLWRILEQFDLIFVSTSERSVDSARRAFQGVFPSNPQSSLMPLGREHLVRFFAAENRWDNNDPRFSPEDMVCLKEGEQVYKLSGHVLLRSAWRAGNALFNAALRSGGEVSSANARFQSVLIDQPYPMLDVTRGKPVEVERVKENFKSVSRPISIAS